MKKLEITIQDLVYIIKTFDMQISLEEIFKMVVEVNKLIDESNNSK